MRIPGAARLDGEGRRRLAGGAAAIAVGAALFTQFSINGLITRDEGIYVYAGQRLSHGTPPYASIVDPKGPITAFLCGLGAALGRLFGRDDLMTIRVLFFGIALLSVLAVYLLVLQLWQSVVGGVAAAVVFASFQGYARAALVGPEAKLPGIVLFVFALWFGARRQWFRAAFTASLAFLTWQPFFPFPAIMVIGAVVAAEAGRRLHALLLSVAAAAAPVAVVALYFSAAGAFGDFVDSTLVYPLRGVTRENETVVHRLHRIVNVVHRYFGFSRWLFWIGGLLLFALVVGRVAGARAQWRHALGDPLVVLVTVSFLAEALYATTDFQNYPDVYPLLPYPAIGFGGAVAWALRRLDQPRLRQTAMAAVVGAGIVLTAVSAVWFAHSPANNSASLQQRASACALMRAMIPGTEFYALGDPVPLTLLHRRNPDRYIYLNAGVDAWKVKHTRNGFAGWMAEIEASHASVVLLDSWRGRYRRPVAAWLSSHGYVHGYIGMWQVFVTKQAQDLMPAKHIALTNARTKWPQTDADTNITSTHC